MENIKKLKEIQKFLKEKNDYWWNKERPDLDLKYYVPMQFPTTFTILSAVICSTSVYAIFLPYLPFTRS